MIDYLKSCESRFSVQPIEDSWFNLGELDRHHLLRPLSPTARLLLTSDGSMTQMLESLLFSPVEMIVERQEDLELDSGMAGRLGISAGKELVSREAWLAAGNRKLIYAHSLLSFSGEKGSYLSSIKSTSRPLGKVLKEDGVRTLRTDCRVGSVKSPSVASAFGLPDDSELWSRYYRLSTDAGLEGIIFELFSPALMDM